ncbi:type VI secretion system contractile sheath domain-containing protein, partial [Vibrio zhanjiangensis]|uniref:type VI secretion system contractile sheath domain-containing protein n=1 Tax=Vibrio zhanjiangensis TaxID=1046128 RepID=UPI0024E072E6
MSTEAENQPQAETAEGSLSFLDRAIEATTQTPADTTKELFSVLAEQALSGTVTWDKNVTKTIENAISEIDKKLSNQLSEVMQQKDFQKLEGSWRGLQKLVKESELVSLLRDLDGINTIRLCRILT